MEILTTLNRTESSSEFWLSSVLWTLCRVQVHVDGVIGAKSTPGSWFARAAPAAQSRCECKELGYSRPVVSLELTQSCILLGVHVLLNRKGYVLQLRNRKCMCRSDRPHAAKQLLSAKAQVNMVNAQGQTAMLMAARNDLSIVAKALIMGNADVNQAGHREGHRCRRTGTTAVLQQSRERWNQSFESGLCLFEVFTEHF
eukprot:Skav218967  [mRNA]  locus=scaffold1876:320755:324060:- [translate_table: standard]